MVIEFFGQTVYIGRGVLHLSWPLEIFGRWLEGGGGGGGGTLLLTLSSDENKFLHIMTPYCSYFSIQ